jgi:flagellar hook assembly protein FlgD
LTFALDQNRPNPFNPTTTISYTIPEKANVSLKIYNNVGQLVKTLIDDTQEAGTMSVVWDGKDDRGQTVSSGLYYYRLVSGNFVASRKMLVLK